jgi:thiol-disulfide isomerase/thioredoxin
MIVIIPLFTFYPAKSSELQPKRTVIAGKVENMPGNATTLLINFCDPLSDEYRLAQDLTASSGAFYFVHDYVFAQNITLRYGNSFINLYVVPGDSIFAIIDGSKLQQRQKEAVVFSGDHAEINEQLFRWTDYAYRWPIPEFDPATPPAEYLQNIKHSFSVMQDTIAAYARRNEMSDFVKQWAFTDYKFVVANYLMDYEDKTSKWSVFTDSIFDVYNEQNFQSMYFKHHAGACLRALVSGNEEIQGLIEQNDYIAVFQAAIKDLSEKAPEGTVRDMMIYSFAHEIFGEKPELYDSIPEWNTIFSQPVFNEKMEAYVLEKLAGTKKPLPRTGNPMKGVSYFGEETQMIVSLPDVEVLPYLCERYKNKALYIDVWTSWCSPCLEEMKSAPALHEYFAGKEVVFVNLCVESTVKNWLHRINTLAIKGENYYLDENATKIFMGMYNISGFPKYLLIDKNGQLHSPVARLSNTQSVIKQIDSLLRGK